MDLESFVLQVHTLLHVMCQETEIAEVELQVSICHILTTKAVFMQLHHTCHKISKRFSS